MNPVSEDFKDILVAGGLGTFNATSGWGIFVAEQPPDPDTTVTLLDGPGTLQQTMDRAAETFYNNLQIVIRGTSYLTTYVQAKSVQSLFASMNNFTRNGTFYMTIRGVTEPIYLGKDEKNRFQFGVNMETIRKDVS